MLCQLCVREGWVRHGLRLGGARWVGTSGSDVTAAPVGVTLGVARSVLPGPSTLGVSQVWASGRAMLASGWCTLDALWVCQVRARLVPRELYLSGAHRMRHMLCQGGSRRIRHALRRWQSGAPGVPFEPVRAASSTMTCIAALHNVGRFLPVQEIRNA